MESKVYSKNDILNKLAQDGFFVDYLTLDSFLAKYKIEAIFEDDEGNEFFDKSAYDILVEKVLGRKKQDVVQQETPPPPIEVQKDSIAADFNSQEQNAHSEVQDEIPIVENTDTPESDSLNKKIPLENIKWQKWDDVSVELVDEKQQDNDFIVDNEQKQSQHEDISLIDELKHHKEAENAGILQQSAQEPQAEQIMPETQNEYWGSESQNDAVESSQNTALEESKKEIQQIMSTPDEGDEDFDDIGLLSDSIQAQEKFQKYIVNELAKRNIDVTPPKPENAFKFDISEKTLNMIARAIAKKIAKQVSMVLSTDQKNNTKLIQAEKKSQMLEQKVNTLEEQNKKLKLLLAQSNKNLNSYKPTFFGLYRFVKRKPEKRK